MGRFRLLICACVLAACTAGIGASAASAETFYVNNERGGSGGAFECKKPGKFACLKISEAIVQARTIKGPNTIEVETEGSLPYNEAIVLNKAEDSGLTIVGEEARVIIATSGKAALLVGPAASPVTVSNVEVKATGTPAAVLDVGASVSLVDDLVEGESVTDGVEVNGHGTLSITGGEVILESASGFSVNAKEASLAVSGAKLINGNGGIGSESGGIFSTKSTLAVADSKVSIEGGSNSGELGIATENDTAVSLSNVNVKQGASTQGVVLEDSPAVADSLTVEMLDEADTVPAVLNTLEGGASTFSHLTVSGTWSGEALAAGGGEVTVSDSHLATSPAHKSAALAFLAGAGRGLLLQRSVIEAGPKAVPGAVAVRNANATTDSSEILGGATGVYLENDVGGADTLTVSASTLAPHPGVFIEPPGVIGVEAIARGSQKSAANANIEGSISLEAPSAVTENGGNVSNVNCSYTAVPSAVQTANPIADHGGITCASGTEGNTNSAGEFASLFSEFKAGYALSPTSSAVDSVPASAVALPIGVTPSATDLLGNPRVVDGNGDCVAAQDKGAFELQAHSAPCPPAIGGPEIVKQLAGVITALSVSPSAFLPAPSGATISKRHKAKKKYGSKVSYSDSQAATTSFTVLRKSAGRKQGRSCKKPSRRNKRGKHCTLLIKVGTFTHTDKAGANSFRFSGRIKGRKLAPGDYLLEAIAYDAAGNGPTATKTFTIK